ncbi:hypothetical protein [Methanofollis tationis]|uniref:Uncharacterized protein n=1 Tax=Methanofollis tationis TaxID=81417 RepID=A0A7K4HPF4_9EURY|nr:hypothetical protein [Methanofollis tationis]NVO67109.1 hypothetical protein [Methanofollis tationis]
MSETAEKRGRKSTGESYATQQISPIFEIVPEERGWKKSGDHAMPFRTEQHHAGVEKRGSRQISAGMTP